MKFQWRDEPPTQSGWYVVSTPSLSIVRVEVEGDGRIVAHFNGGVVRQSTVFLQRRLNARWAGPIPQPDGQPAAAVPPADHHPVPVPQPVPVQPAEPPGQDPEPQPLKRGRKPKIRPCVICGAPIPFRGTRKTCSPACLG